MPLKGFQFFHFNIHVFRNVGTSGVSAPTKLAPPTGNPGSATEWYLIQSVHGRQNVWLVITQKLTFLKPLKSQRISPGRFHQNPCGFHVKSGRFHVKSTYKTYKSNISRKTLQFYGVLWEGYVMFSHEICQIS